MRFGKKKTIERAFNILELPSVEFYKTNRGAVCFDRSCRNYQPEDGDRLNVNIPVSSGKFFSYQRFYDYERLPEIVSDLLYFDCNSGCVVHVCKRYNDGRLKIDGALNKGVAGALKEFTKQLEKDYQEDNVVRVAACQRK
jgi:hypothetical protein